MYLETGAALEAVTVSANGIWKSSIQVQLINFSHFGGLKIFTTLDSKMQQAAHDAAKHHIKFLEKESIN